MRGLNLLITIVNALSFSVERKLVKVQVNSLMPHAAYISQLAVQLTTYLINACFTSFNSCMSGSKLWLAECRPWFLEQCSNYLNWKNSCVYVFLL